MAFKRITPARFGADELAIAPSLTTVRTTPLLTRDIVKTMDIANNGTTAAVVSVYLVESGGIADNTNILIPSVSIPKNTIFQWTGAQVMNVDDTIQGMSSIADVSIRVSGGEAV